MNAHFLLVMLLAIDGQEEIRNQAGHDLHHKAIRAAGQAVIQLEVLFPPAEEFLDFPAGLVDQGDLFGGQITPVGGHPIFRRADAVAHQAHRLGRLVGRENTEPSNRQYLDALIAYLLLVWLKFKGKVGWGLLELSRLAQTMPLERFGLGGVSWSSSTRQPTTLAIQLASEKKQKRHEGKLFEAIDI